MSLLNQYSRIHDVEDKDLPLLPEKALEELKSGRVEKALFLSRLGWTWANEVKEPDYELQIGKVFSQVYSKLGYERLATVCANHTKYRRNKSACILSYVE